MKPHVSIVIPSFNQGTFLEQALTSVLSQNNTTIELIVVDNCSTDSTRDILKKYAPKVAQIIVEPDSGQSDALNKGFQRASGEWLGWLNADDYYAPSAFSRTVYSPHATNDCDVIYGDVGIVDDGGNNIGTQYAMNFSLKRLIYDGFHLYTQGTFWRRSIMDKYGEVPVNLHKTMDYDLFLGLGRICGEQSFRRVPGIIGYFRRHSKQKTQPASNPNRYGLDADSFAEHLWICNRHAITDRFTTRGRLLKQPLRISRKFYHLLRWTTDLLQQGNRTLTGKKYRTE